MKHIDPSHVFEINNLGRSVTFQEILDSVDPQDCPQTDEELKDLLWCFEIDPSEVFGEDE